MQTVLGKRYSKGGKRCSEAGKSSSGEGEEASETGGSSSEIGERASGFGKGISGESAAPSECGKSQSTRIPRPLGGGVARRAGVGNAVGHGGYSNAVMCATATCGRAQGRAPTGVLPLKPAPRRCRIPTTYPAPSRCRWLGVDPPPPKPVGARPCARPHAVVLRS